MQAAAIKGKSKQKPLEAKNPRLKFPQCLPQSGLGIDGAHQAAALQCRHQPLADLVDEAAAGPLERCADQKAVSADLLHRLGHFFGHLVRRADQIELAVEANDVNPQAYLTNTLTRKTLTSVSTRSSAGAVRVG